MATKQIFEGARSFKTDPTNTEAKHRSRRWPAWLSFRHKDTYLIGIRLWRLPGV